MSDCDEPARRRLRREPDIPQEFSALPIVQKMITENNLQTKLKRRLKPSDFINEVFTKLGDMGVTELSTVSMLSQFLKECVEKHKTLPRSSSIAKVLYIWTEKGMLGDAEMLMRQILQADSSLHMNIVDEKIATVALRLLTRSANVDMDLAEKILAMLPVESHKRRLFFPLLEHAARTNDIQLALKILRLGRTRGAEFWDVDYHQLLSSLQKNKNSKEEDNSNSIAATLLDELLQGMVDHHPVVGKSNGELLQGLMGGEMTQVDNKTGECQRCGTTLSTFDFEATDRDTLLNDIETKLIAPRVDGASRYEPERMVTPVETERRWQEFETFKAKLAEFDYDAVIDGANVGYYGLSRWYREAKEKLLRSRGVDPKTVPEYQLCDIPLPVDVPPKFSLINEMLIQTRRIGKKPLVMLHNRHVESPSAENAEWLLKWKNDSSLIACPGFINDDYCWLYAAIRKPNCLFVSNDQMRDHHFVLLSQRSFLRWRQRHRVTYRALYQRVTGSVTLLVVPPRPFAVWVQRGRIPSSHWHIPILSSVDIIDQATNHGKREEIEMDKDGDDSCDTWLCTADKVIINRNK
ncbi:Protein-only RNase P [Trypanosoma melophagium]|uniref:Protein-only RNase P n=1 Tax=Trypanosoma melophagium TaxID=715481 RepID=UPI003519DBB4|nr:Protein-only RNase P [Trypanosoma melophagium]